MRIISIGEILWDMFGETEHLGGASFNFAAHARRLGHEVFFVSAVGADERGRRALSRMAELGLTRRFVRTVRNRPTGLVTVFVDGAGQPDFTIHRPAAYDYAQLSPAELDRLSTARIHWIYFGTLHQVNPRARELTGRVLGALPNARRFYDINLRKDCHTPALVLELLKSADAVKLNDSEVAAVEEIAGTGCGSLQEFCRAYSGRHGWRAVCVTRGARGCVTLIDGDYAEVDGYPVRVADTVGAGDAFAAAFVHGLENGWPAAQVGDFANRVGALVASRAGGIPPWTLEEALALRR